jgi:hypothetical protein
MTDQAYQSHQHQYDDLHSGVKNETRQASCRRRKGFQIKLNGYVLNAVFRLTPLLHFIVCVLLFLLPKRHRHQQRHLLQLLRLMLPLFLNPLFRLLSLPVWAHLFLLFRPLEMLGMTCRSQRIYGRDRRSGRVRPTFRLQVPLLVPQQ